MQAMAAYNQALASLIIRATNLAYTKYKKIINSKAISNKQEYANAMG